MLIWLNSRFACNVVYVDALCAKKVFVTQAVLPSSKHYLLSVANLQSQLLPFNMFQPKAWWRTDAGEKVAERDTARASYQHYHNAQSIHFACHYTIANISSFSSNCLKSVAPWVPQIYFLLTRCTGTDNYLSARNIQDREIRWYPRLQSGHVETVQRWISVLDFHLDM